MTWIDWSINIFFVSGMFVIAWYTKGYMKGVADFLAANRLAGRYLMTIAAGLPGAISIAASWEAIYKAGLPTQWWSLMSTPVSLFLILTGFIVYRFRQTRALTLAQFFEMRYSRNFRIFSGSLSFISGILNYGIFPMVTANFMIYFFGLPHDIYPLGIKIPMFPLVMGIELIIALCLTLTGGQITILLTEFYQGMITMIMFTVLVVYVMFSLSWSDIVAGLQMAPEGQSMINPLKTGQVEDFNVWFYLIGFFAVIYNARSWQGTSAYNACPRTPHEAKMSGLLGGWRGFTQGVLFLIIPIAAYSLLHLPKFAEFAAPIHAKIAAIPDPQLQTQMTVPLFLNALLPVGIMGLFAGVIIASAIHTDETYLHSWGTIFVQDVLAPCLKKPLTPKMHMLLLRLSIVGVAIFAFIFSMLFPLKDYILMYFSLTGAIYMGGAGAVIIGGLYWKRGTTAAAWASMIIGSVLAFGGMSIQQLWPNHIVPVLLEWYPHNTYLKIHADKFPLNGMLIFFFAMMASLLTYVLISLLGPRQEFDMDKMLHRGKYAVAEDQVKETLKRKKTWKELLGLTPEFSRGDRALFWATFGWNMGWWLLFLIGTFAGLVFVIPDSWWAGYWWFKLWLSFVLGIGLTVWFFWGGLRDMKQLFADLRSVHRNAHDDGTVSNRDAEKVKALPIGKSAIASQQSI